MADDELDDSVAEEASTSDRGWRASGARLKDWLSRWSATRWVVAISAVAALAAIGVVALLMSYRLRLGCSGGDPSCGCAPRGGEPGPTASPAPSSPGGQPSGEPAPSGPDSGASGCSVPGCGDGACSGPSGCGSGTGCSGPDGCDVGCGDVSPDCGGSGSGCGDSGSGCGDSGGCGSGGGAGCDSSGGDGCDSSGGGGGCSSAGGGGGGDCSSHLVSPAAPHLEALATLPIAWRAPTLGARIGAGAIRAYRRWLSPRLGARCRYSPTCSRYALDVIERYGLTAGAPLAVARIRRCTHLVPLGTLDPAPGSAG